MTDNTYGKVLASDELASFSRVILALQHLIAMFGATVLVPILTGFDTSVAIFCAGLGTLIFHFVTKGKVPVFLGSSFAFIPVILAVSESYGGDLAYAQGGIIVAGLIYCLFSLVVSRIGIRKIQSLLPAHVIGPMIIVIGMNLIPTAFSMAQSNFILAGVTLATALFIRFKTKGFVGQLSIIIAVFVGYIFSIVMKEVDFSIIRDASLISAPSFRLPKFDFGAIAMIAPVVLAVFMEHLGDITTNGQVVGKNFIEDPGLHRTLLGDGLATMAAGFLGGPANTTYGENTGVLAITKNYDPSILRLAAIFAIILSFVGKIGGVLSSIPTAVMGGISLMLFTMIALVGTQTIKNSKVKFNFKNVLVMATILILGLGSDYLSKLLGFTIGVRITDTIVISGLSFAALVGIVLNQILSIRIKK
ncbi:uracil-xanthine permease family protein [Neofamilia massiliensis]|uniref:uracil-xanthine permease family protein n=1 Tax=Neofamilia massiliensis TaxID=1673724 RepID=UPI0006BB5B3C|nr:uracil-xanthine permease family protein [Neofamilia massiliensis]